MNGGLLDIMLIGGDYLNKLRKLRDCVEFWQLKAPTAMPLNSAYVV